MAKRKLSTKSNPSQRMLRVGELVRHDLSQFLLRDILNDPAINVQEITIPEVRMSPDLRIATVFVTHHDDTKTENIIKHLERHKSRLRAELAKSLKNMKYLPDLRFMKDTSFETAARLDSLFRSDAVRQDLKNSDSL